MTQVQSVIYWVIFKYTSFIFGFSFAYSPLCLGYYLKREGCEMGFSKAALDFSAWVISIIHGALRRRGVDWGGLFCLNPQFFVMRKN